jgi:hypothetical protein
MRITLIARWMSRLKLDRLNLPAGVFEGGADALDECLIAAAAHHTFLATRGE